MKYDNIQTLRKEIKRIETALPKMFLEVSKEAYYLTHNKPVSNLSIMELHKDYKLLSLCRVQLNSDFGGSPLVNRLIDRLSKKLENVIAQWQRDFATRPMNGVTGFLKKEFPKKEFSVDAITGFNPAPYKTTYVRRIGSNMVFILAEVGQKVEVSIASKVVLPGCGPRGISLKKKDALAYLKDCIQQAERLSK